MYRINNLRKIREIYGATQEEISKVAGINRSTLSMFETGTKQASFSMLEKLSLYYGVGPEYFYKKDLDEVSIENIKDASKKEKEVKAKFENKRSKADEFSQLLETTTFLQARGKFMFAMKMLLATADYGELEDLKVAHQITEKMTARLKAIIDIREKEEKEKKENDQATLFDLLDAYTE